MVRKKLGRGRKNRCRFCTKEGCPRPTPSGRGDEAAAERAGAEDDVPRPYPRPDPFTGRRRYRWLTESEFGLVLVACVVMLVLGGVVVGTYLLWLAQRGQPAGPPA